jgi:hypothetical protein
LNLKQIEKDFYWKHHPRAETHAVGSHAQCMQPVWPSCDGAWPGPVRPITQCVYGPRRRPHGTQGAMWRGWSRATVGWSTGAAIAQRLFGGEGGGPAARGVAPSPGEALGPAHEYRKWVRWLSTNGLAEIEARHGGGSLPEADKRRWHRRNAMGGGAFYMCAHGERG